jgi:cytochrome c oxidase subunit 1
VASLGAFALGGSLLVFVYNVIKTSVSGAKAPADPWDGATLEWATSSPPPEHDFDRVPKVTSSRPYWDEKHETPEPERDSRHWMPADAHIHVPNPTFWPVVASFGVVTIFGSFLFPEHIRFFVTGSGLLILLTGMLAWLHEPLE